MSEGREGGVPPQEAGKRETKKFSTDISGCNIMPLEGKWKGVELSLGWRSFDTFDLRNNVLGPDDEKIPVAELEGLEVEIIPHEEE